MLTCVVCCLATFNDLFLLQTQMTHTNKTKKKNSHTHAHITCTVGRSIRPGVLRALATLDRTIAISSSSFHWTHKQEVVNCCGFRVCYGRCWSLLVVVPLHRHTTNGRCRNGRCRNGRCRDGVSYSATVLALVTVVRVRFSRTGTPSTTSRRTGMSHRLRFGKNDPCQGKAAQQRLGIINKTELPTTSP